MNTEISKNNSLSECIDNLMETLQHMKEIVEKSQPAEKKKKCGRGKGGNRCAFIMQPLKQKAEQLLREGRTYEEISQILGISSVTIGHVRYGLKKTGQI